MSALVTDLALEAQAAVLGSMLTDPEIVGPMLHQLTPEDFTGERYRNIFRAIRKLRDQGKTPDPLTVNDALGGTCRELLAGILEVTATSANAEEYAAICRRTALQSRWAELGEALAEAAGDLERQRSIVDRIAALGCEKPGVRITNLRQCYEAFLDRHADGGRPAYFTWGIPALDGRVYVEPGISSFWGAAPARGRRPWPCRCAFTSRRKGGWAISTTRTTTKSSLTAWWPSGPGCPSEKSSASGSGRRTSSRLYPFRMR